LAAVWSSDGGDGNGYGISLQILDVFGTKIGSEIIVNTNTAGD